MTKNLLLFTIAALFPIAGIIAQTGPGGVGGHENALKADAPINALWLRADDLNLNDGDFVTSWLDVSGYNHNAVPGILGTEGIIFQEDRINGKPWLRFFGVNYLKVNNHDVLDGGEGHGIFVVAKRDPLTVPKYEFHNNLVTKRAHWNAWSHATGIPMTHEGLQHAYELRWDRIRGADNEFHPDTASITAFANGNLPDGSGADVFTTINDTKDIELPYLISYCYSNHEESYGSFVRVNGLQSSRRAEGNPNPLRTGDVVKSSKDLWIGAAQYDPPGAFGNDNDDCPTCEETGLLEGAIAEVIIYKGTLWHTQVFIIENYLSLKYDLPLVDTVKYYDDEVFIHDLAGIGNEFGDDKKHSVSQSHAMGMEELDGTLDAPKEYLFAAHDGAAYEWTNEGLPDDNLQRWARTWKLEKNGEMDVQLSFNFITAELNLVNSHTPRYRLAYRATPDEDFTLITEIEATRELKTLNFIVPNDMFETGYYAIVNGYEAGVGIDNLLDNFTNSMSVFPSPATDMINVKFASNTVGDVEIRLIDLTGRQVASHSFVKEKDHFETQVSLGNLNNGVYFVEIINNGKRAVKRIIKK